MITDTERDYRLFHRTLEPEEFRKLSPEARWLTLSRVEAYLFDQQFNRAWKQNLVSKLDKLELTLSLGEENIPAIRQVQEILDKWNDSPL